MSAVEVACTAFSLPPELSASAPAEFRGMARDAVRLLVAAPQALHHARFRDIGMHLRPGDLLVVNTSATRPAAIDGARRDGRALTVHLSTALDDGSWVVELRQPDGSGPVRDATRGESVALPEGASVTLLAAHPQTLTVAGSRLWRARITVPGSVDSHLATHGRPITYGYVSRRWPLSLPDRLRARQRQRGDAERRPAVHPAAGRRSPLRGRARRAGAAPHRGLLARGPRGTAGRAIPGARIDGTSRRPRPPLGGPGDRPSAPPRPAPWSPQPAATGRWRRLGAGPTWCSGPTARCAPSTACSPAGTRPTPPISSSSRRSPDRGWCRRPTTPPWRPATCGTSSATRACSSPGPPVAPGRYPFLATASRARTTRWPGSAAASPDADRRTPSARQRVTRITTGCTGTAPRKVA